MKKLIPAVFAVAFALLLSVSAEAVIMQKPRSENIALDVIRSKKAPVCDGVISDGEYGRLDISDDMMSYVVASDLDWRRIKTTDFSAYAAVFEENLYFAVTAAVPYEFYITECEPKKMWAQSCLLLSLSKTGASGRNALELGLREDGVFVFGTYDGIEYEQTLPYAVSYEGGVVVYEIVVPLSAFDSAGEKSFLLCFSLSVGDFFNDGRYAYIQLGQGISGFSEPDNADAGKDASLFPIVHVTDRDRPNDPDKVDPPETGIDATPYFVVCALSAATFLLLFKRLRIKIFR